MPVMLFVIRDAVPADLEWINSNEEGWTVKERAGRRGGSGFCSLEADRVFVAADERGELLGWMCVIQYNWHSNLVLQLLYVDRRHRGRGVSRALVEDLLAGRRTRSSWAGGTPPCSTCGSSSVSATNPTRTTGRHTTSAGTWSALPRAEIHRGPRPAATVRRHTGQRQVRCAVAVCPKCRLLHRMRTRDSWRFVLMRAGADSGTCGWAGTSFGLSRLSSQLVRVGRYADCVL